ncbi:unnamed protein product [Prorocentrum cordatum]|uniref:Uncharacterized protein n=1 Tax=Prorocentrum cordatum TaxID=2364126 RepID=A0ABN9VX26_9DINO|nr:unnamed protein product [Polarella glacialis]
MAASSSSDPERRGTVASCCARPSGLQPRPPSSTGRAPRGCAAPSAAEAWPCEPPPAAPQHPPAAASAKATLLSPRGPAASEKNDGPPSAPGVAAPIDRGNERAPGSRRPRSALASWA